MPACDTQGNTLPMKILITGDKGFLGVRLRAALEEHKHDVVGFDIADGKDITNVEQVQETFAKEKPDICIHLAAVANLNFYHKAPEKAHAINVTGTHNILKAAGKTCKVYYASTCCGYGDNHCHPCTEDGPTVPTEKYAQAKIDMEPHVLRANPRNLNMRLATLYGPNMRRELAPAIFLERLHRDEPIQVHGDGSASRTMTYVDDIVSGIVTLVNNPPAYGLFQTVNITTEESVTILDMIHAAEKVTGKTAKLEFVADRSFQIPKEEILSRRLQSLGWKPSKTFLEGMVVAYAQFVADGGRWTQSSGVDPSKI